MGTENDIDQLFKRGLNDPEIPFNELDWVKMERKLDEQKKRRIIPLWVYTASGIAAAVLIFLFWFLSGPSVFEKQVKNPVADQVKKPSGQTPAAQVPGNMLPSADSIQITQPQPATDEAPLTELNSYAQTGKQPVGPLNNISAQPDHAAPGLVPAANQAAGPGISSPFVNPLNPGFIPTQNVLVQGIAQNKGVKVISPPLPAPQRLTKEQSDSVILSQKAIALAQSKDPFETKDHAAIARSVQKNMDNALSRQPGLILSAMAAPDITSGPSNKSSKISSNVGLLGTYALGSKFSLTSGAIYAKKYYNSGGTTSGSAGTIYTPGTPAGEWEVKADCNVLDIPLNVNYKLMNKKRLSVSVNTGLSSYFMLKEKYDYYVDQPGRPEQVSSTEYTNQNQHLFGIANVAVSIDHKISDNMSVGVQPFAKIPLTGIGANDVTLKSAGVSFSLSIGLFPAKKPGKLAANRYSSLY